MKNKKILPLCLGLSLFLHCAALFCFQHYSLWFSSSEIKVKNESDWLSLIDKQEKDEILKTTFESLEKASNEPNPKDPTSETVSNLDVSLPLIQGHQEPLDTDFFRSSFALSLNDSLIATSSLPIFSIPQEPSINLLDHLPKDLIIPQTQKEKLAQFSPFPATPNLSLKARVPPVETKESSEPLAFNDLLDRKLTESPQVGKAPQTLPIPKIPKLPTLAELETSNYSDSFEADLIFLKKSNGEGYDFALTLIPKHDLNLPRMKQHITFLIDKSNSIQQRRLTATKIALHKALSYLHKEDTFNIIAFDSKSEKMSPNNLPCTDESFAMVEEFLDNMQLGSFFSTSDLFKPLFLTVPGNVENNEVYTAILLTDGEGLTKKGMANALLYNWTQYNQGKVSLFALTMNDPQSGLLETITAFNRGKLYQSTSYRGLKRKLPKLLKTIENPIAKNLVLNAINRSPQSKITLFPNALKPSNLYLDQPFVILGETDSLDDFILFVQGKLNGRWLNIRKTISFLNARKANPSLRKEIAIQKAYQCCEQFRLNLNFEHIVEAQEILKPYELEYLIQ